MPTRSEIAAFALRLRRTPFHHQGRAGGTGLDCAGLVLAVADHFGITPADYKPEPYDTFPAPAFVRGLLNRHLTFVGGLKLALLGDVGLISDQGYAVHLGIFGELDGYRTIIHASRRDGGVVEHIVDRAFARLVRGVWRYPGVTD